MLGFFLFWIGLFWLHSFPFIHINFHYSHRVFFWNNAYIVWVFNFRLRIGFCLILYLLRTNVSFLFSCSSTTRLYCSRCDWWSVNITWIWNIFWEVLKNFNLHFFCLSCCLQYQKRIMWFSCSWLWCADKFHVKSSSVSMDKIIWCWFVIRCIWKHPQSFLPWWRHCLKATFQLIIKPTCTMVLQPITEVLWKRPCRRQ